MMAAKLPPTKPRNPVPVLPPARSAAPPPEPPPAPPPAPAAAPPPPPAPRQSKWLADLLRGLHCLHRPRTYFEVPPLGTPLRDYFSARRALNPEAGTWNITTLLGFATTGPDGKARTDTVNVKDPTILAQRIAGGMASPANSRDRYENLKDLAINTLAEINSAIINKLRGGETHPLLVNPAAFRILSLQIMWGGGLENFACVRSADIPEGSLLNAIDRDLRPHWGDGKVVVLGLADHSQWGQAVARPFYRLETARIWTSRIGTAEKVRRRDGATPDQALDLLEKGEDLRLPIKGAKVELPPTDRELLDEVQPPSSWLDRLTLALEVGRQPGKFIVRYPSPDATLDDLLRARIALGVLDHDKHPDQFACERLANTVAGTTRYRDLTDLLSPIISAVDRRLEAALERGLEFAALAAEEDRR